MHIIHRSLNENINRPRYLAKTHFHITLIDHIDRMFSFMKILHFFFNYACNWQEKSKLKDLTIQDSWTSSSRHSSLENTVNREDAYVFDGGKNGCCLFVMWTYSAEKRKSCGKEFFFWKITLDFLCNELF